MFNVGLLFYSSLRNVFFLLPLVLCLRIDFSSQSHHKQLGEECVYPYVFIVQLGYKILPILDDK